MSTFQLAILLMASPASVQIQTRQASADEVALNWDNAWRAAKGLCQDQVISTEVYEAVTHIDQELEAIESSDIFWSDEALRHDSRWENFRIRAQILLAQLG